MIDLRHLYDEDQRDIVLAAIQRHKAANYYRDHRNMWDWGNAKIEEFKPLPFTVPEYQKPRRQTWKKFIKGFITI